MVGYYTLVEKLFYAFTTIGGLVSQTIYPYMSRTKDLTLLKKILWRTVAVAVPGSLILMYFNEIFLKLIFDVEGEVVSTIFLIVFSSAVFSIVSSIIGYPLLAAFGYPKHANNSLIYSSLIYLVYIVCAVFLTKNIYYVSLSLGVYMISGLLIRVYFIYRTGLFKSKSELV
jgi:PST family polysaccharide transporter